MSRVMHPALAEVVASRRLGGPQRSGTQSRTLAESRHRFTVSRDQALLQLRAQTRARDPDPWAWTIPLVRAANALCDLAEARISNEQDQVTTTTIIDVIVPGFSLEGMDLSDLLAGALEADLGEAIGLDLDADARRTLRLRRFRMLLGRALNEGLAEEPIALEVRTPAGGRRFDRRERVQGGANDPDRDPYGERKTEACVGTSRFIVRRVESRAGWGTRLGRWLRRRSDPNVALLELWSQRLLRETDEALTGEDGQVSMAPSFRPPLALGRHARLGIGSPGANGCWLVRDGVKLLDLAPALANQAGEAWTGWIDCPGLKLTADEASVVRDSAFDLLVAWLNDVLAHRQAGEGFTVAWPDGLPSLATADARPLPLPELERDFEHGRERVYVWKHRARDVPAYARAKVLALWPSELERLRHLHPHARLVPLRALGGAADFDPADLTSMRAGSFEPLILARDLAIDLPAEQREAWPDLRASIEAYIHRAPSATMGFIEVLAYERRIASERERSRVISGVTLLVRLDSPSAELDVAVLRRTHSTLAAVLDHARRVGLDHREALLAHVIRSNQTRPEGSRSSAWDNPVVRGALDELDGPSLDLSYAELEGSLRLAWRDSVLLDVVVARDRDEGPKTLRDTLRQLREPGMIVLAKDATAWPTLQSADPRLRAWVAIETLRPLLARVVGASALVDMPVVPEAHPLIRPDIASDQRHLLRTRETIAAELEKRNDRLSRLRLLGHLLVARALGHDTCGLEGVPLLDRYDPRALTPLRMVSLNSAMAERPRPGLVPLGCAHRNLSGVVLEVGPGVAALLHDVAGFDPHSSASIVVASAASESRSHAPIRRRARDLPPLLARSIVHSLFVGRLQVAADGSSDGIALWSKGLEVGRVELEEPLGRVSGRLWLTADGQRSGPMLMRKEITDHARTLVADALHQRALLHPEGPERRRLDHFVEYARAVVAKADRYGLASSLGVGGPADRAERVSALRKMSVDAVPLRPLQPRRDGLLADVVKQSLAMPIRFDAAILQWRPAKLGRRRRDGSIELEFGLRNAWIKAALDEDQRSTASAHREAALRAGVIVVAEFFVQARDVPELQLGPEHLVVALWRLLRLSASR